jgi:hypothetical protein
MPQLFVRVTLPWFYHALLELSINRVGARAERRRRENARGAARKNSASANVAAPRRLQRI